MLKKKTKNPLFSIQYTHSISLVEKWYRIDNHENHLKCDVLFITIKKGGLEKVIQWIKSSTRLGT